jgi:pimeloyl-ACP methyl ester carboxylesterase
VLRRIVGGVAFVLVAFVVIAPALFRRPERLALKETPQAYGLRFDDVTFAPSDRPITLKGWWMPAAEPRAAVILVHGGGEDNRALPYAKGLALAHDLVGQGFSVLTFDLRNYGESDGTPEGVTYGDLEAYDVQGAVAEIARRAPGLAVGAIGCSMGGATVIQAAVHEPHLGAIVADSAFADARRVAAPFVEASTGWPPLLVVPVVWSAEHLWGLPLARGQTSEAARRLVSRPALVIHNTADPIAPLADAREIATALIGSEQWITPAPPPDRMPKGPFGTHCQSYALDPAGYVTTVTAFLTRGLRIPLR